MGRYTVGGSGPVCKTGAYYARMVRAHLFPPSKYGRVAQLEEHRKIIDSCKVRVVGSIPTVSSTKHICLVVYTDQPKSSAGANLGKCRIKSELRGICGIRITVSIPVFQTGGEGSIPLSHTILDPYVSK